MAWTNIDNALVSVGALPFATTIQALRDNPIAIANGDSGAPQIQTAALVSNERMTTNNVNGQIAGSSAGEVGSYAFLRFRFGTSNPAENTTHAGSGLRYADSISLAMGGTPAGTWRLMGITIAQGTVNDPTSASLFLRIS
jgi:hypothetical protein